MGWNHAHGEYLEDEPGVLQEYAGYCRDALDRGRGHALHGSRDNARGCVQQLPVWQRKVSDRNLIADGHPGFETL